MATFNFKIRNIKGYGDTPNPITLDLDSNKVNFIVAPNGAGKSSFVTAFECLSPRKIDVPKELKYKKQERTAASLTIEVDDKEWIANGRSNKISNEWNPTIINSRINTTIEAVAGDRGAMVNEPVTKVASICIFENIPPQVSIPYDYDNIAAGFGVKKRALKDHSALFGKLEFLLAIKGALPCLNQFKGLEKAKDRINQLVAAINRKEGNVRSLKSKMTDADFKTIEQFKNYKAYKESFKTILGASACKLDYFLLFYQLFKVYSNNTSEVKAAIQWAEYENFKTQISSDLECVKCPWKGASLREFENNLYVDYPLADEYSNGQRDIMTLYTQLLLFKRKTEENENKKHLLLLDEVFDYLDDANLLAAQYFISSLLDKEKVKAIIYILLFTHLDPCYYRTYILSKLMKVHHLEMQHPIPNTLTKCFIGYRDWLNEKGKLGDTVKGELYQELSNHIFHYHPADCNYQAKINANQYISHPAKETWGKKSVLYKYLIDEVNKYFAGSDYDPYAVAFAVRIRVEKIVYGQIPDETIRESFLAVNKSYDKIKICTDNNINVPVFYMIVIAIGNEADHLKEANGEYKEKEMVYKLKNKTIKNIIEHIFNHSDSNVPISIETIL